MGYGAGMTIGWGSLLTELVPLALVVALSPLTVIPAVLVLHTSRPRQAGLAFGIGWLVSVAALTAIFVAVSGLLGGLHKTPPAWASWLRIVVGSGLIVFGIFQRFTRERRTDMPGWMRSLTEMTPPRAGLTATALAVIRPEVLLMCAAAGLAVGSAGLDRAAAWAAAAFFVALAASSVVAPVVAYASAGDRLDPPLARLKEWMEQQHAALTACVLIVIGVMVAHNGIHAL